jgi:hypothetical protein
VREREAKSAHACERGIPESTEAVTGVESRVLCANSRYKSLSCCCRRLLQQVLKRSAWCCDAAAGGAVPLDRFKQERPIKFDRML